MFVAFIPQQGSSGPGVTPTLQQVYDASAPPSIVLDATGGISITDAAANADSFALKVSSSVDANAQNGVYIERTPAALHTGDALQIHLGVNASGSGVAVDTTGNGTLFSGTMNGGGMLLDLRLGADNALSLSTANMLVGSAAAPIDTDFVGTVGVANGAFGGHVRIGSVGGGTNGGDVQVFTLAAGPGPVAGSAYLFAQDVTGVTQLWVQPGAGAAFQIQASTGGDVVGPGASTDNAITRFDGLTGKLIQNSTVTLDDVGAMAAVTAGAGMSLSGNIAATTTPAAKVINANAFTGAAGAAQVGLNLAFGINQTLTASFAGIRIQHGLATSGAGGAPVYGSGGGLFFDAQSNGTSVTQITSGGLVRTADGAVGAPANSFISDTTTGFYRTGAGVTGYSSAGALAWSLSIAASNAILAGAAGSGQQNRLSSATAGAIIDLLGNANGTNPAFLTDNATAFTAAAGNQLGTKIAYGANQSGTAAFTALQIALGLATSGAGGAPVFGSGGGLFVDLQSNGTSVHQVTSAGLTRLPDGTNAAPSLSFISEPTLGLFRSGANSIAIGRNGTTYWQWTDNILRGFTAGLAIRNGTPGGDISISGQQTSLTTPAVTLDNTGVSFTGNAGLQQMARITATVNASGTASFAGLTVDITYTAVGSGTQRLIDAKNAGTSKWYLNSAGGMGLAAISPAALASGTTADYSGIGGASFARLTPNAANSTISGITGGTDGLYLTVVNVAGSGTLSFTNEDAGSTAANRIITSTGATVTLNTNDTATFIYDATTSRWRQVATVA